MNIRDLLERLWWTFVAAATGNITAVALLDIAAWKMAVATGLVAAVNLVTIIARWRLSVLPDPGAGLPGLPTDDPPKKPRGGSTGPRVVAHGSDLTESQTLALMKAHRRLERIQR